MNFPLPINVCGRTALLTGNKKGNFFRCLILGTRLTFFAGTASAARAKAEAHLRKASALTVGLDTEMGAV